jgi:BirA family transcriptional regulator, biotin operon repressor / biotin---[acetyl-CoA-carboxylase] ligase
MLRWRVEELASCPSTNTLVADRARAGAAAGLVVRAETQTAGRGRLGRSWEAPPIGNLLVSLLLDVPEDDGDRWLLPATVLLAAREGLVRLCGVRPDVKWPNDLQIGAAKLAGMLSEVVVTPSGSLQVVVGLGVNLVWSPNLDRPTTSIRESAGLTIAPMALVDEILRGVDQRSPQWSTVEGRALLRDEFGRACVTLGQFVRVDEANGTTEGLAEAIADDGALVVRTETDARRVTMGDVVHLRGASS